MNHQPTAIESAIDAIDPRTPVIIPAGAAKLLLAHLPTISTGRHTLREINAVVEAIYNGLVAASQAEQSEGGTDG